ncbi:MAG: NTP transferase domain-containing protein [Clostridiales bacterium]|jgi:mannose-1-phosphate guanylyltransferase/phosphomannomutase|nr:NTP transferase domain-containing protein [Clostridiales bacterium]
MKAVIMAGGEGTRLRPITCTKPKPMLDVLGKPVMQYIIELLKNHNITDIAVTLQYMPQAIVDYFGDGRAHGVNLQYFIENRPLGTAGSVKNAQSFMEGERFLVISGDCMTNIDLTSAIKFHEEKQSEATIVLTRAENPLEYGVVMIDDDGKIVHFLEKPDWSEVFSDTINTGIYILENNLLDNFAKNEKFDFSNDLFPMLLEDGKRLFGYPAEGYWCDIGDSAAYIKCNRDLTNHFISPAAVIDESAKIIEPVHIESGAVIGKNASVLPYSVIGQNAQIHEGASVKQSIINRNVVVGKQAQIRGAIICDNAKMDRFSAAFENAIIGANAEIGEMSEVNGNIKIWTGKKIGKSTAVTQNIVWGSSFTRNLFGEDEARGRAAIAGGALIMGEVNVDVTPEFATRLGAAFGATLKAKSKIGVSYGSGGALLMLKNAFISGVLSSGCEIYDFNVSTLPIMRSAAQFYNLDGGVYLSYLPEKPDSQLSIQFVDKAGVNLSRARRRKLEQFFMRDDFLRCEPDEIGNVTEVNDFNTFYVNSLNTYNNGIFSRNGLSKNPVEMQISVISNSAVVENLAKTTLKMFGMDVYTQYYGKNMLTAFVDDVGESVIFHDEKGEKLTHEQQIYLMCKIIADRGGIDKIALPSTAPSAAVEIAKNSNITVITVKNNSTSVQEALIENNLDYQFNMMFDANFAIAQICEYIQNTAGSLHAITATMPTMYFVRREVDISTDNTGAVIRQIAKDATENGIKTEPKDGVKMVHPNGWIMVLPHRSRAGCQIVVEAATQEIAEELCARTEMMVKKADNSVK